jgi:endonuclease/exonuclease/phosphatase family metal-dependent hydrolase
MATAPVAIYAALSESSRHAVLRERIMPGPGKVLRFFWWNVQSFAHYDPTRASDAQWPQVAAAYAAKCQRVDATIRLVFADTMPELLAFAEITRLAAEELRDRLFPGYQVLSLDLGASSELQVAIIYNPAMGSFHEESPVVVPYSPRGTRPMAVLDHVSDGHRMRFIACHWTARFSEQTEATRQKTADHLNRQIFEFVEGATRDESRHVVVLGDLNTEPYGLLEERMHATRDRARSRIRHYTDVDTERVRLYNCAWRFLGERVPHFGTSPTGHTAGTLFWDAKKTWHTFDHVLVTASLLTESAPYLDELSLRIVTCPLLLEPAGRPLKYEWQNGNPVGVSDHLPISGQVVLEHGSDNANF